MNNSNWLKHQELTKNNPPSKLLIEALQHVGNGRVAIDIGDGALKDARYLLQQGFDVTVIDQIIRSPDDDTLLDNLHCHTTAFDQFEFKKDTFDLATAMFALPFNPPESFDAVFDSIKSSLKPSGIFCGQFFGTRDEWSNNPKMTFHTKEQVEHLLSDLETISLVEIEKDSKTADGNPKHWHIFHVIARKV